MTDWEMHRTFLSVLRAGSLSGAARALGLVHPTVRRRIEALEAELGAALFTRAPSGLIPTATAERLRSHAEAMELAAAAFARAAAEDQALAGPVRISASEVVSVEVLPPILAPLRAAHPAILLELSASNRNEDLLRREADIAVRMVAPRQEALVARRIGTIPLGLFARRDMIGDPPRRLEEVIARGLIGVEQDNAVVRAMRKAGHPIRLEDFALRSDSDLVQLAAIRAGLGIGICQVRLGEADPRLVRILPQGFQFDLDCWVVMHEDLRSVARVRAVFERLVAGLLDHVSGAPS
ncbi:LysR family transcriptional regulator [Sphingosinicella sp. BN140058]|uniref:LysR family transcriptional regulator n=1 Tax=Sphingosinicella sp. BN140058 TaxID=1892855 RepID=UPI001012E728|nr:LysR family transcriptional regulator [Sphingosinicella sp. BN140058]QAY76545.1 LysR family transcriptional regulator [Sphingosinicella sp. BN140058]